MINDQVKAVSWGTKAKFFPPGKFSAAPDDEDDDDDDDEAVADAVYCM